MRVIVLIDEDGHIHAFERSAEVLRAALRHAIEAEKTNSSSLDVAKAESLLRHSVMHDRDVEAMLDMSCHCDRGGPLAFCEVEAEWPESNPFV